MRSLRFRIISVLMVAVLIVGIIAACSYYDQSITNLKRNRQDATINNLSQVSRNISQYLYDIRNITMPIYIHEGVQRLLRNGVKDIEASIDTRQYVSEVTDTSSFIYDVVVLDVDWNHRAGVHGILDSDDLFRTIRQRYDESERRDEWLGPIQLDSDGEVFHVYVQVNAVRDIADFDEVIGYFCVFLDERAISNSFKYMGGDDASIGIASQQGNILFHSESDMIGVPVESMLQGYDAVLPSRQQTIWKNDIMITFLPAEDGMTVFSIESLNHFKLERSILYKNIILVLLLGIVISITCGTLLIMNILRPLGELRRSIVQMGKTGVAAPIEVKRHDEVGQLTNAYNKMTHQIQALMSDVSRLEHEKLESEIYLLQTQINPHFVFNTLVTIRILAERNGERELSDLISNFSRILRESMKIGRQFVTLREEMECIRSFCAVQQLRYSHRINLHIDIDPSMHDYMVLKFLLQIPVENSIKHGFEDADKDGNIWIRCQQEDGFLQVIVEDDGAGFSEVKLQEVRALLGRDEFKGFKNSIGLLNLRKRLQLHYGAECDLHLSNTERGACVSLRVPVQLKGDDYEDSIG